jgi:hypothetical protein
MKWNGFLNVNISENTISAEKDQYEIGESIPLSLIKDYQEQANAPKTWKVSGYDDNDDDFIDEEALLDEDDFKKPDPTSLRVCGTTGVRKACKDCSCGLADELASEGKPTPDTSGVKSSCGSCYLGDAFRCAGCPYLGTPAFKPGEIVTLSDDLLKPDM